MASREGLVTYNKKRNFERTREPPGKEAKNTGFSYVIQKHAARRLHYDFRLELDGVLLSWAVPKGPSLDPRVKRLAVQTEDHPIAYGNFEGTIPEGEYGAGTVLLWDRGSWEPDSDPRVQYEKGHLSFTLHGERLKGSWHLVRTRNSDAKAVNWLLFKGSDAEASEDGDRLLSNESRSVVSERTLEEIRAGSDKGPLQFIPTSTSERALPQSPELLLEGARKAELPASLEVELATLMREVPVGPEWLHEVKLDGYRVLARVQSGKVELLTRNGKSFTERAPSVVDALAQLEVEDALFDGEVVVLREDGISDFQLLQNALSAGGRQSLVYFVFDLLHWNGRDLRAVGLEGRKQALASLIGGSPRSARLRLSDHVTGEGQRFFEAACKSGLEGIVSKRRSAPYQSGRTRDWVKIKCSARQEFVIGGFTEPGGSRAHLGAILVGVWDSGQLRYSGKVGTGFTQQSLKDLHETLAPLERSAAAFSDPPLGAESRGVHWVEPVCVAEVEFTEFTGDGRLRHPTFRGLRADKAASEVIREQPLRAPAGRSPSVKATERSPETAPPLGELPRGFRLTHPERILYPEQGTTKLEVAQYYAAVAAWILPHVADRPLTLVRCPQGHGHGCFFQKHTSKGLASAIHKVPIREDDGTAEYMSIDSAEGLLALAQMSALELHTWGAHVKDPERPDLMVFDLDPDESVGWPRVVETAVLLRSLFEQLDLQSYVKTTGGKGLHVCIPFESRLGWDEIKSFCHAVADALVTSAPDRYVATMAKAQRKQKIFIDYLRNGRGATFIAPYSTRARPGAPVAVPVAWEELPHVRSDAFSLQSTVQRLAALPRDPWRDMLRHKQTLSLSRLKSVGAAVNAALTR